ETQTGVTGTWTWKGAAGWQRILFEFKSEGNKLTGRISMGPRPAATSQALSRDELWELFYDPVVFQISNGRVDGNTITFEQNVNVQKRSANLALAPIPFVGRGVFLGQPPASEKFTYTGVFRGDKIDFTREFTAARDNNWSLGRHKVEFTAERIK